MNRNLGASLSRFESFHRSVFQPAARLAFAVVVLACGQAAEAETTTTTTTGALTVVPADEGQGWTILSGNEVIAGYVVDSAGKPIVYPIHSPAGRRVVRDYPMGPQGPKTRDDHPHHRSLWLTHGEVNDQDFWSTSEERQGGTIRQTAGQASANDDGSVVIETTNDWLSTEGKRVLSDHRRFTFRLAEDARGKARLIIDCDFRLTADDDEVHFGDTKEGTFGIRVAGPMKVDAKLGGSIINKSGDQGSGAWGKASPWVDYTGPAPDSATESDADDETLKALPNAGITIHYHPSSHAAPCRWHVRTYGLFAANPFGVHHFDGGPKTDGYRLPAGESINMFHRVVVHDGPFDRQQTLADEQAYATAAVSPVTGQ
ncbi:hypothetical protein Mal65_33460 [Crateriforma conspicua]|nr:hypothetical protein Mal65_33460 [Crateriforma conspicua]